MPSWQFRLFKIYFTLKRWFENGTPSVEKRRKTYETLTAKFKIDPAVQHKKVMVNGVPAEWMIPPDAPADRAVLFLHGGAYCLCSVNTHRSLATEIAKAARMRVLSIDYRLAPENPFPAALEDSVNAYHALLYMGTSPGKIAVAGDSAGGGLALALLISLRDAGAPLPAAAVCISPWTDLSLSGESMTANARKDVILDYETLEESARIYLDAADARTPLASPLFADFYDLPPLLIQVGSDEIILSDAVGVAENARAAGVDVTLDVWDSMQHEWQFAAEFIPEGRQAVTRIGEFLQQHITSMEHQ
jgi:acetyl esterase/lipase